MMPYSTGSVHSKMTPGNTCNWESDRADKNQAVRSL